jgi:hypothetical protein
VRQDKLEQLLEPLAAKLVGAASASLRPSAFGQTQPPEVVPHRRVALGSQLGRHLARRESAVDHRDELVPRDRTPAAIGVDSTTQRLALSGPLKKDLPVELLEVLSAVDRDAKERYRRLGAGFRRRLHRARTPSSAHAVRHALTMSSSEFQTCTDR